MSFLLSSPSVIEGIGPRRAELLERAGIETIADMFAARAPRVGALIAGVSPAQVGSWFCAAMLLRIDGMTKDVAEAFVEGGIRSVPAVADAGLRTLERAVANAHGRNRLADPPSIYKLGELQREAWRARARGMVCGRLRAMDDSPIAGADVEAGLGDAVSDGSGRYAFDSVPEGRVHIVIGAPGVAEPLVKRVDVRAGKLAGPFLHRFLDVPAAAADPVRLDEFEGDMFVHTSRYRNRLRTLPLAEFRDGTHFLVREVRSDGPVRLLSLYKKRIGRDTLIERATAGPADVPTGTVAGRVLELVGGALESTALSSADVAARRRALWVAKHPTRTRIVVMSREVDHE